MYVGLAGISQVLFSAGNLLMTACSTAIGFGGLIYTVKTSYDD